MIEHFDNVGLILHQNQVSGARACRDGDHANDGQYVFGVQSRPQAKQGLSALRRPRHQVDWNRKHDRRATFTRDVEQCREVT
jgi:hypothetical protein